MTVDSGDELARLYAQAVVLPPAQREAFLDAACEGNPTLRRLVENRLAESAETARPDPAPSGDLSPERWNQVQQLFEEILPLDAAARTAYLDDACADDDALRAEVESLAQAFDRADEVLHDLDRLGENMAPPLPVFGAEITSARTGTRVSHYQVLEKLGGGGMGVVYKAQDTALGRLVALKFLPERLHSDDDARRRFLQEAKTASALDHPNLCTIYEIGETDDGHTFIAMACYSGETLKKKVERGPLPVPVALDYAIQTARGLARAHSRHIIHRDIKPANVMVAEPLPGESGHGIVKVLDFGLAKMADVQMTRTGTRMGTAAYMSPEQARGQRVDHRTDIWSLGVLLYEMLTGQRPFGGDYDQAIIYAVLNEAPPPLREANPDVPEDLAHVVAMCLEKDPALRYPSMADVLADLEIFVDATGPHDSALGLAATRSRRRRLRPVFLGAAVLVGLLALGLLLPSTRAMMLRPFGVTPAPTYLAVLPFTSTSPEDQVLADGLMRTLTSLIARMETQDPPLWVVPAEEVHLKEARTASDARTLFGVTRVVTGSVQRLPGETSLILSLIDPDPERPRILETRRIAEPLNPAFERAALDALEELLNVTLSAEMRRAISAGGETTTEAYQFYLRGIGYLQRYDKDDNLDRALGAFRLAIDQDSLYASAHAGLCEASWQYYLIRFETEWVERAQQSCDRALALNDQQAPVHVTLGRIFIERGQPQRAEDELNAALALEPNNDDAYRWLGKVYEDEGKLDQAEAAYRQAVALKPDYWVNYTRLGEFYFYQGRHDEAYRQFEQVIRLTPDNYTGYSDLGIVRLDAGDGEAARRLFERSLELKPTLLGYLNLARVHFQAGRYAESAATVEKARSLNDDSDTVWWMLGDAAYWAGDTTRAHEAWRQALTLSDAFLAINPNDETLLSLRAALYAQLGDTDEARRHLGLLFALTTPNAYTLHFVVRAHEILGERELALRYLGRALEGGLPPARIETDPWLEALRATAEYRTLRASIEADRQSA